MRAAGSPTRGEESSIWLKTALARAVQTDALPAGKCAADNTERRIMHKIQRTLEIKAPVQRVYDFINQPANLPGIWPSVVSVSNIVASKGGAHDFDWTYKMAGALMNGHSKVEDAQSGKSVRVRSEGGIPATFNWTYAGLDGAGTRLTMSVEYTIPATALGKLSETLVTRLNERDIDMMLANMKDVIEHATLPASAGARPH
jgi:hypothetical protein